MYERTFRVTFIRMTIQEVQASNPLQRTRPVTRHFLSYISIKVTSTQFKFNYTCHWEKSNLLGIPCPLYRPWVRIAPATPLDPGREIWVEKNAASNVSKKMQSAQFLPAFQKSLVGPAFLEDPRNERMKERFETEKLDANKGTTYRFARLSRCSRFALKREDKNFEKQENTNWWQHIGSSWITDWNNFELKRKLLFETSRIYSRITK